MNHNLQGRLARLEDEAKARGGVRYVVSDTPMSEEEWERRRLGLPALEDYEEPKMGPPMTEEEWEREFCTPA